MRILVTGATGFIGSHLIPELSEHEIIATDRDLANLAVAGVAERLIDFEQPDYVVHLAARYGRILCRDQPHRAVADNAAATTELAAACAKRDIPVLYTSSSEVYGDHGTHWIKETSELRTPTTIYGLSKRWGEEALKLYLPPEQLTIVRLNMVYGPEQRGGYGCCALATFIRDALEDRPMTVHAGTSRSWLYISDAVKALRMLIEDRQSGTWNLGNSHEYLSAAVLARMVVKEVGAADVVEFIPPPSGQIAHKHYVTDKIEARGWKPTVPTREGIKLTVQDARAHGIRDYEEVAA